jgi:hypothetical protein
MATIEGCASLLRALGVSQILVLTLGDELGKKHRPHDVELRVRRGVEEDPAGYDWTSMGRIRVPADRADLVGCLPQRRFGPPWRPPWLTLVTAHSRRREQAFYNFTSPILQFRID